MRVINEFFVDDFLVTAIKIISSFSLFLTRFVNEIVCYVEFQLRNAVA